MPRISRSASSSRLVGAPHRELPRREDSGLEIDPAGLEDNEPEIGNGRAREHWAKLGGLGAKKKIIHSSSFFSPFFPPSSPLNPLYPSLG